MSKKRRTFDDAAREVKHSVVPRLLQKVDNASVSAIAVGIDMAAKEDNWGLSLISLDDSLSTGTLDLLLPHRTTVEGFKRHCPVKPSTDILQEILVGLRERSIPTALAVDVPMGWPIAHGEFSSCWSACDGMAAGRLPERDDFEYRKTDLFLRDKLNASIFAVGADKIASASFEWAKVRAQLSALIDSCDVGFGSDASQTVVLFETYPAAFVRFNYEQWIEYKSGETLTKEKEVARSSEDLRIALVERLLDDYKLSLDEAGAHLDLACSAPRSDAIDGFLSALCAWDYLRFRRFGAASHAMSTPKELIGATIGDDTLKQIEKEGWILTRTSPIRCANEEQTK